MRFFYDLAGFGLGQIIVFGCLLMGGFYFFKYDDGSSLRGELGTIQGAIQKMDTEIREQEQELRRIEKFKSDIASEERSVSYLLNYLPNELSPVDIFSVLTKEARIAGVDIEDKRDSPVAKGEFYDTLKLHLTVKGSFAHVLSFMSHLTEQKWILVVDRIEMRTVATEEGLKANLDIFAFRYKTAKPAEEGGGGKT